MTGCELTLPSKVEADVDWAHPRQVIAVDRGGIVAFVGETPCHEVADPPNGSCGRQQG